MIFFEILLCGKEIQNENAPLEIFKILNISKFVQKEKQCSKFIYEL